MSVFKAISNLLLSLFSDGQIDTDDCDVDGDTLAAIGVDEDRIDEICLSSSNESAVMGGGGVSADCRFGVEDRIESRFRELEAWKGGLNESIDRAMGSDMNADTISMPMDCSWKKKRIDKVCMAKLQTMRQERQAAKHSINSRRRRPDIITLFQMIV